MTELLTSIELEYEHPTHCQKPVGAHLVVHIRNTEREYHHKHSFKFGTIEIMVIDEALLRLSERIADADINEDYLKASPHWESNQA